MHLKKRVMLIISIKNTIDHLYLGYKNFHLEIFILIELGKFECRAVEIFILEKFCSLKIYKIFVLPEAAYPPRYSLALLSPLPRYQKPNGALHLINRFIDKPES